MEEKAVHQLAIMIDVVDVLVEDVTALPGHRHQNALDTSSQP